MGPVQLQPFPARLVGDQSQSAGVLTRLSPGMRGDMFYIEEEKYRTICFLFD